MKFRNMLPQLSLLIVLMLIVACQSALTSTEEPRAPVDLTAENGGETPSPIPVTAVPSPTFTPQPTTTATPLPTNTPEPTQTLTPTPNAESLYEENYQKGISYAEDENWEKAVEALLAAVESDPDNGQIYKAYNALGLSYDRLGELDRAIANFDQAIDKNPTFADCYANRGDVWRDLGEPEKAFADYDQAIELDPTVPRYF